jgi:hypothetical protein
MRVELDRSATPVSVRAWIKAPSPWLSIVAESGDDDALALPALDEGECAAIALATALHAELLLMEDRAGVAVTGTPGPLVFLRNHTAHIAGTDLFVVPTVGYKLVYGLVILRLARRRLVLTNVTANPTADWPGRSPKPSPGTRPRHTARRSRAGYTPWLFATGR